MQISDKHMPNLQIIFIDYKYQRNKCQIYQILHKFQKQKIPTVAACGGGDVERALLCCRTRRIRAAVCLHAGLGCLGDAIAVIGVGTGWMTKPSARAVLPVGLSSLGQEIRLFTKAKTT
jgi:hypothetical protein